ncbi:hypothetical protein IVB22_36595 [Bradyrhizobium sp. 190]|uniref:CC0125/CC1285 family lipoprotein n=1 Tax=Bradyrhizobium sp. 190 TaxID=2782658 RepID=UPI001FFA8B3E|nr:hypothetical protein [Bradyrhizobium sp. 190]MCK1517909.1 hypothetical protein [Bradyrhizobium sp. 190]
MRASRTITLVVTVCLLLAGCGTKYQEMGFTGGVSAEQITKDTYRIAARGNGNTRSTTIQDYALLKAAEITKAAGATHFAIISAADATTSDTIVMPGTSTTTFSGNTAYTTRSPGYVDNIIKPGQDVHIRVLKLAPGQQMPSAYSADEIIQFIGPRVQRD